MGLFAGFTYFFIENFDDHLLNSPGVSVSPSTVKTAANNGFNGSIIDQVGLNGGCPAGGLAADFPAAVTRASNP